LGRADGAVTPGEASAHIETIASAVDLPLSADLENGYGPAPEDVARAVRLAAAAGAVGGSIEDYDPAGHLYDRGHAVERVAAAVEAARSLELKFTLTARAENHIRGNPDLADTLARLQAYEEAGADVLYAPGLTSLEEIATVCREVAAPVNVLARPDLSLSELVAAGVQRVSVGGSLAWVTVRALAEAATAIRDHGDFSALTARSPQSGWPPG
jgi:2-methylisocitrate lyase-like PEP mutase family enzyme